jgi:outer membrane protein, heavy metal efflux system
MIRKLNKALKIFLILMVDLEGNEVKVKSKQDLTKSGLVKKEKMEQVKKKSTSNKLTLESLLSQVNKNFPLIAAAFQDMRIAEADTMIARGAFDPVLRGGAANSMGYYNNSRFDTVVEQPTTVGGTSFFAGYRLGAGSFPPYYGQRATNQYGEVRAGARVPLWRDHAIDNNRAGLKRAEIGIRLADLSIQQQKIEIFRNASLRYWEWIASVERYKIAKTVYDIAVERQKQIQKRVAAGDMAQIELKDNERIVLQREAQLLSAEQGIDITSNELAIYLQENPNSKFVLKTEMMPEDPFGQLEDIRNLNITAEVNKALDKRPEIQRFKAQKDQNRIDEELARNDMKPGVDLVVAASQDFGPGSVTRSQTELEANLILNVPLATRRQRGRIDSAVARNKKLDAQEEFLRNRIEADIKNTYSILNLTRQRSDLAKKELILAKQLEKAELDRFMMGEGTLILVNIREQTTAEAAFREVDALTDHNRAIVNFKASIMDIIPNE